MNVARSAMVDPTALTQFSWQKYSALGSPRFACLSMEPINRRPVYRYCEHCLAEDETPFFRQQWRYACSYVCEKHRTTLRDHCPSCSCRLDPSSKSADVATPPDRKLASRFCRQCGADLSKVESHYLPEDLFVLVFAHQRELINLIHGTFTHRSPPTLKTPDPIRLLKMNESGQIDLRDTDNVMTLFNMALSHALELQRQAMTSHDCEHRIWSKLRVASTTHQGSEKKFGTGIEGVKLFGGRASLHIAKHMMACQSLVGSTFWWKFSAIDRIDQYRKLSPAEVSASWGWISNTRRTQGSFKQSWW